MKKERPVKRIEAVKIDLRAEILRSISPRLSESAQIPDLTWKVFFFAGADELLIDFPSGLLDGQLTGFCEGSTDDTGSEWEEGAPKGSDPSKELSGRAAKGSTTLLFVAVLAMVSVCKTGPGEAKMSIGAETEAGFEAFRSLAAPAKFVSVWTIGSEEAKKSNVAESDPGCEALLSLAAPAKLVPVCTTGSGEPKKSTGVETEAGCEANRSTSAWIKGKKFIFNEKRKKKKKRLNIRKRHLRTPHTFMNIIFC